MCNVYFCVMEKETKIYGLRAIIEAIEAELEKRAAKLLTKVNKL